MMTEVKTVLRDGEAFEYDAVVPISELEALVFSGVIASASAMGTGLSRELYLRDLEDGKWVFFGSDGFTHRVQPDEPAYVRFVDTTDVIAEANDLIKRLQEAKARYSE
jgi:hypothetical protein